MRCVPPVHISLPQTTVNIGIVAVTRGEGCLGKQIKEHDTHAASLSVMRARKELASLMMTIAISIDIVCRMLRLCSAVFRLFGVLFRAGLVFPDVRCKYCHRCPGSDFLFWRPVLPNLPPFILVLSPYSLYEYMFIFKHPLVCATLLNSNDTNHSKVNESV